MLQPVVGQDDVAARVRGEERASRRHAVGRHRDRKARARDQQRLVAGVVRRRVRGDQRRCRGRRRASIAAAHHAGREAGGGERAGERDGERGLAAAARGDVADHDHLHRQPLRRQHAGAVQRRARGGEQRERRRQRCEQRGQRGQAGPVPGGREAARKATGRASRRRGGTVRRRRTRGSFKTRVFREGRSIMKQLLCLLAVLCCAASAAMAGPNAGGVLWVHDTGIEFSSDLTLPPVSTPPADCAGVDNQQDVDGVEKSLEGLRSVPAGKPPASEDLRLGHPVPGSRHFPALLCARHQRRDPGRRWPGYRLLHRELGFPDRQRRPDRAELPLRSPDQHCGHAVLLLRIRLSRERSAPDLEHGANNAPGNRVFGDDATPTNEDPIMGYGSLGFGTAGATPCPVGDPDAACCAPGGSCTITRQSGCAAPSVWHEEWYVCTPNPCPQPPTGACCFASGACWMVTQAACASAGGAFLDGPCEPNPCSQPGACCLSGGSCSTMQQVACVNAGGAYYGGPCTPNPCPQPTTGACCFASGSCSMLQEIACTNAGGGYYGESCTPNPCPQPITGACCFASGFCSTLQEIACTNAGGVYYGGSCTPNPCPQPITGACCFASGFCSTLQEIACTNAGGVYHGGSCTPNPCPQPPPEACCFAGGVCSLLTPVACANSGGVFHGGTCEPNPCSLPPPTAACCAPAGSCSVTTQANCPAPSVWHAEWPSCTPNPCPQIPSGTGDTFATAFVLPAIPCTVGGTTVGYNNDYDEVCPYSGSTAPDVVYRYVADGAYTSVNIDLCYSSYDTKVYVYDANDLVNPIACNDDYYFASSVLHLLLLPRVRACRGRPHLLYRDRRLRRNERRLLDDGHRQWHRPAERCVLCHQRRLHDHDLKTVRIRLAGSEHELPPESVPAAAAGRLPGGCSARGRADVPGQLHRQLQRRLQQHSGHLAGAGSAGRRLCRHVRQELHVLPLTDAATGTRTGTFRPAGVGDLCHDRRIPVHDGPARRRRLQQPGLHLLLGVAGDTGTLTGNVIAGQEVGFFAANSGFSGYPIEGTYVLNVCGIDNPSSPPGACCNVSGECILTTPDVCAFSGGTFLGDPTCVPNPCMPVATETTSWGAIKARFLQPDAQPVGATGRPGSRSSARVTPKPTASPTVTTGTTRPSAGPVPDILGTTRPPKPGSSGMRGGK